ncbi:phosphatidylglycerophosphatase A [Vibrio mangrovi]|uniref:Phosphatidylglycerophosphatase A n=1 Tax=Vibrio mangrovi TaxID=474394 RepID=A0A1Y6ITI6_9VIBR|nr:phosphatidylglycerophosphatase A [Vibrio mangrovi]MDW6001632.1 phosphatidylglycerophosphatase A [Vibrio mangrovi]SMS00341.1 Phosphatidylglycerophosphatase A [Vibrio mangrovi]
MKPTERLNLCNPWHLLATGFGSGLSPVIPGTMGTLAAIPFYLLLAQLPFGIYVAVIVIAALVGIKICQKTSDDMQVHDHGSIVWDEFVGFWITMLIIPYMVQGVGDWSWIASGFVLFRFFDMVKPWPISWLDRHVEGGFGIMIDDVLAGIMAGIVLTVIGFGMAWFG